MWPVSIIRQTDGITGRRLLSSFLYYFPSRQLLVFPDFVRGCRIPAKRREEADEMIEVHPSS
jgi:hypothetical protein